MLLTVLWTGLMRILRKFIKTGAISILHVPLQNDDIFTGGDFNFELDTN